MREEVSNQGLKRETKTHMCCPLTIKGEMVFVKDEENKQHMKIGESWYCPACHTLVKRIPFPSYEDYREMERRREEQRKRKKNT